MGYLTMGSKGKFSVNWSSNLVPISVLKMDQFMDPKCIDFLTPKVVISGHPKTVDFHCSSTQHHYTLMHDITYLCNGTKSVVFQYWCNKRVLLFTGFPLWSFRALGPQIHRSPVLDKSMTQSEQIPDIEIP